MSLALISTVFLMGLLGGTHCLAMCAAPCATVVGAGRVQAPAQPGEQPVLWQPRGGAMRRPAAFHLGRLVGYGLAGALAALTMDGLAWMGEHSAALRPLWSLAHVLVLVWGLAMLAQARQPAWIEAAGRAAWARVRPWVARPGGIFLAGTAWALLPCGLLYTALMTAALSGSPAAGALSMVAFGLGSGAWLVAGPWAWRRLRAGLPGASREWGARAAGLVLCVLAGWALWMQVVHGKAAPWCAA